MVNPRYTDALGHGMSDKRVEILRGIARTGSISQAAREAGVSYKAAWQAIDTLSNLAGVALLERAVGGAGGGGASLTAHGTQLLDLADALEAARRSVHERWTAGQRSAAAAQGMGAGQALARLALRTSMRNQLPARVEALEAAGRIVRVRMQLGESGRIAARITQESAQLLGLAPGMPVVALCKATAVRIARQGATGNKANVLAGTASRVARGDSGDEVTVALAPGLQLVGFAPAGSGLRTRARVSALVDESAVVVALEG
ncbi:TOBE domain-containing protein [Variovorax sp. LARHSF232]